MNNIRQKNVILDNATNTNIPYENYKNIAYGSGQSLATPILNNTFRQLVDNDLYVQAKLNEYRIKKIGPGSSDSESVKNGPNGYKFWSKDADGVAIYHKIDDDLNDSITKVSEGESFFTFQFGDYTYSGTSIGFMRSSDTQTWETVFDRKTKCYVIFEDTVYIGTSDSVYRMSEQYEGYPEFTSILTQQINGCNSIFIDSHLKLNMGTDNGFFRGDFEYYLRTGNPMNIVEYQRYDEFMEIVTNEPVNAVSQYGEKIIAAQTGGVFAQDRDYVEINPKVLLDNTPIEIRGDIQCTLEFGGGLVIGTSKGLFFSQDPYSKQITELNFPEVVTGDVSVNCLYEIGDFVYIGSDMGLFKMQKFMSPGEFDYNTDYPNILKIRSFRYQGQSLNIFCSGRKLIKFDVNGETQEILEMSSDIVDFEVSKNGRSVFIVSRGNVYIYNMYGFDVKDRDKIHQMESVEDLNGFHDVIEFKEQAYCHNTRNIRCLGKGTSITTSFDIKRIVPDSENIFIFSTENKVYSWDGTSSSPLYLSNLDGVYNIYRSNDIVVLCRKQDGKTSVYVNERHAFEVTTEDFIGYVEDTVITIRILDQYIYLLCDNDRLYTANKKNSSLERIDSTENLIFAGSSNQNICEDPLLVMGTDSQIYTLSPISKTGERLEFGEKRVVLKGHVNSVVNNLNTDNSIYACGDMGIVRIIARDDVEAINVLSDYATYGFTDTKDRHVMVAKDDGVSLLDVNFNNIAYSVLDSKEQQITIPNIDQYLIIDSKISGSGISDSRYVYGIDYDSGRLYRQMFNKSDYSAVGTAPSFTISSMYQVDDCIFMFGNGNKYRHVRNIRYRSGDTSVKNPVVEDIVGTFSPQKVIDCPFQYENNKISKRIGIGFQNNRILTLKHVLSSSNKEYPVITNAYSYSETETITDIGYMESYDSELSVHKHMFFAAHGNKIDLFNIEENGNVSKMTDMEIPSSYEIADIGSVNCTYSSIATIDSAKCVQCSFVICLKTKNSIIRLDYNQDSHGNMSLTSSEELFDGYDKVFVVQGDNNIDQLIVSGNGTKYILYGNIIEVLTDGGVLDEAECVRYYVDIYNLKDKIPVGYVSEGYMALKTADKGILMFRTQGEQEYDIFDMRFRKILRTYDNIVFLGADGKIYYTADDKFTKINSPIQVSWDGFDNENVKNIEMYDNEYLYVLKNDQTEYHIVQFDQQMRSTDINAVSIGWKIDNLLLNSKDKKSTFGGENYSLLDEYLKTKNRYDDVIMRIFDARYYLGYNQSGTEKYSMDTEFTSGITHIETYGNRIAFSNDDGMFTMDVLGHREPFSINGDVINFPVRKFLHGFPIESQNDLEYFIVKKDGSVVSWYTLSDNTKRMYTIEGLEDVTDMSMVNEKCTAFTEDGYAYELKFGGSTIPILKYESTIMDKYDVVGIGLNGTQINILVNNGGTYSLFGYIGQTQTENNKTRFKMINRDGSVSYTEEIESFYQCEGMDRQIIQHDDTYYWLCEGLGFKEMNSTPGYVNGANLLKGKYILYVENTLFTFDDSKEIDILKIINGSRGSHTYNTLLNDGKYMFAGASNGVYRILESMVFRVSGTGYYGNCRYIGYDQGKYTVSLGNEIFSSTSIRNLGQPIFTFDRGRIVNHMYKVNDRQYIFSLDDGIYTTNYSFQVVNDIKKFGEQDAMQVYEEMTPSMDEIYNADQNIHIRKYHEQDNLIDYVHENIMDVNFDNMGEWTSYQASVNGIDVENDIVYEISSGTEEDEDMFVDTINSAQNLSALNQYGAQFNYILKRWRSGFVELFVNIPTTNTYYLPFNRGVPGVNVDEKEVLQRKNLINVMGLTSSDKQQNSVISSHYTTIELNILSSFLYIDSIHDIHINGSSLPLGIYRTEEYSDGDSKKLYRSFIEPSLVGEYDITQTTDGYYKFKFYCFGTDQQSIRISTFDTVHNIGEQYYVVRFDSNGGSGQMKEQIFQRGQIQTLLKNKYTYTYNGIQMTFRGWSLGRQSINTEPQFQDEAAFSDEIAGLTVGRGDVVTLYAVWMSYMFEDSDTTMTIQSNQQEFSINKVGLIKETPLGNKILINYGD